MPAFLLFLLPGLLVACSGQADKPQEPSQSANIISVVATNDFHGRIVQADGFGGLPLLAGYLSNLRQARAEDGGSVVLVDAGDVYQGTLESILGEGRETILAFNELGYDAVAIGNHEFDFGPVGPAVTAGAPGEDSRGALKARAIDADFPLLAANLVDLATYEPVAWRNVRPSIILEKSGVRIGIIGVSTSETLVTTIAANMDGLGIAPLAETIVHEATGLRQEGADVVIVAAHAGGECAAFDDPLDLSSCDTAAEIFVLASELPEGLVDVIAGGHIHAGIAHLVNGIAVISSFSNGEAFGRVDLVVRPDDGVVVSKQVFSPQWLREDPEAAYEGRPIRADEDVIAVLAPAIERATALRSTPLGVTLATPIRKTGRDAGPLGNLVVGAIYESVADADVVLLNSWGFINADLPAGPLRYGAMYEVLPFDNLAVKLRLRASEVKQVLLADLQRNPRVLAVGGIEVNLRREGTSVDVELTRMSGEPITDAELLTVVTTDFLANGGDDVFSAIAPAGGLAFSPGSPVARDLVIGWLQRQQGPLREDQFVGPELRGQ